MYPTIYPTATAKPTKKPTESPTKTSNDDDEEDEDEDDRKKDDDEKVDDEEDDDEEEDDKVVEATDDNEPTDDLYTPSPTPFIMNPSTTYNPTPTDLFPTSHTFSPTPRDYTGEPSFVPTPTFLYHSSPPSMAQLSFPPTFNPTASPVKSTNAPTPELSPTFAPTTSVLVGATAAWYQTTAFIVSISLLGIFLLCVGVFNFYWSRKAIGPDPSGRGPPGKTMDAKTFIHMSPNDDVENVYSEATEETSLLKGKGGFSPFPTTAALTAAVSPSSRIYFRASDLGGGAENDAALFPRFQSILSTGIVTNLHTTKGPKPVVLSMVGNEVRWQAVKTAQKRYKLNLRDVISVEIGKQTSNFVKSRIADDDLCFSLVTQKTTLDLEANNKVERDSLVRGFQIALDSLRKSNY